MSVAEQLRCRPSIAQCTGLLAVLLCSALSWGNELAEDVKSSPKWMRVEPTMQWCGARAVWIAASAYGIEVDFPTVLRASSPNAAGESSLYDLVHAIRSVGLASRAVKCDLQSLMNYKSYAVTVHKTGPDTQHAYLFVGVEDGSILAIDPFKPAKFMKIDPSTFASSWTGETLLIAKVEAELQLESDRHANNIRLLLTGGAVLLLLAALAFKFRSQLMLFAIVFLANSGCSSQPPPDPLRFQDLNTQVGTVFDNETIRREYRFVNGGSQPIKITEVQTSCTCTQSTFSKEPIRPGDSGTIVLESMTSGRRGALKVTAKVHSTTDQKRRHQYSQQISMTMNVVPRISVLPNSLVFGDVEAGKARMLTSVFRQYRTDTSLALTARLKADTGDPDLVATVEEAQVDLKDSVEVLEAAVKVSWRPKFAGMTLRRTIRIFDGSDSSNSFSDISVFGTSSHPDFVISPRSVIVTSNEPANFDVRFRLPETRGELNVELETPGSGLEIERVQDDSSLVHRYQVRFDSNTHAAVASKNYLRVRMNGAESPPYRLEVLCLPKR